MINIQGKNCILELLISATYYPILCGEDFTVNYNPEFILKTGPNSPARERMPRIEDWSVSVNGITELANTANISWFYLLQASVRRSLLTIRAKFINDAGTVKTMKFNAYVGQSSISAPIADFCPAAINFEVSGGIQDLSDPDVPITSNFLYLSDWWQTVAAQTFVNVGGVASQRGAYMLTATDIVLEIDREGTQYDEATTPAGRQGKFNTSNLHIEFNASLPFDSGETIFVLWKRPV